MDYIRPRKLVTSSLQRARACVLKKLSVPEMSACVCRDENSVDIMFQRDMRFYFGQARESRVASSYAYACFPACAHTQHIQLMCTKFTKFWRHVHLHIGAVRVARARAHTQPRARMHSLLIGTRASRPGARNARRPTPQYSKK